MTIYKNSKALLAAGLLVTIGSVFSTVFADTATNDNSTPASISAKKQFEFLIGSWDCTYLQYSNTTDSMGEVVAKYPCDWNAKYTFDGHMVQDDFQLYYEGKVAFAGTTLRTWVQNKQRWDLAFLSAGRGHWPNFHGTWQETGMEIAASGSDQRGDFVSKIRFVDIKANSFLWEMEKSYDDGKSWYLDTQIKTTRKTHLP